MHDKPNPAFYYETKWLVRLFGTPEEAQAIYDDVVDIKCISKFRDTFKINGNIVEGVCHAVVVKVRDDARLTHNFPPDMWAELRTGDDE